MDNSEKWYEQNHQEIAEEDTGSSLQSETFLSHKATTDARRLGDTSGERVLEVGPGLGHLCREMETMGASVDAVGLVDAHLERGDGSISGNLFVKNVEDLEVNPFLSVRLALKQGG